MGVNLCQVVRRQKNHCVALSPHILERRELFPFFSFLACDFLHCLSSFLLLLSLSICFPRVICNLLCYSLLSFLHFSLIAIGFPLPSSSFSTTLAFLALHFICNSNCHCLCSNFLFLFSDDLGSTII